MFKPFGCKKHFCVLLQSPVISFWVTLIMVTITRHIVINIFQTEHFSAEKFAMGLWELWAFLLYQNLKKKKKNEKKNEKKLKKIEKKV